MALGLASVWRDPPVGLHWSHESEDVEVKPSVNVGARLDRLPISSFHYRIFWLIGAGMLLDGYDLYVFTNVLPAAAQSGFSTAIQNADFISKTFLGMTIGALVTGFLGDRYGRRFTYQINLLIFGAASLAATFAPDMTALIWLRFIMGLGLGAEIVVGYSTLTEFVPPKSRGRWLSLMAVLVVSGLPITALLGYLIIPAYGWRPMFAIAGVGALVVWYLRKALPESPRWLEAKGRTYEAEALMRAIEAEAGRAGPLPTPAASLPPSKFHLGSLLTPPLLPRMIVCSWLLITINTLLFGFVTWLPQFFLQQGLTITRSFAYTLVITLGTPFGALIGAFCADSLGRRRTIIAASIITIVLGIGYARFTATTPPWLILTIGFLLIMAIYVQVAMLFGVYTPELFPTDVRLRANGICHTLGRAATIVSPFIVLWLSQNYGIAGVLSMMIALLALQILAVWRWGVEPRQRPLEQLELTQPLRLGAAS
jgi:MFS transporter, putative metabolite:H+ symporter